tara:strand:+ start:1488 stop:1715 length:228 start_codon:yes stop_codon:yes gene_type:complete
MIPTQNQVDQVGRGKQHRLHLLDAVLKLLSNFPPIFQRNRQAQGHQAVAGVGVIQVDFPEPTYLGALVMFESDRK